MRNFLFQILQLFICIVANNSLRRKRDTITRPDPKIVTTDGNLNFQSATNRNISFQLDGSSDVWFGDISFSELKKTIDQQTREITELKKGGSSICRNGTKLCSENGVCIDTAWTQTGYKCLCQPGYTGDSCQTALPASVCALLLCKNGGSCSIVGKEALCLCPDNWFGKHCDIPTPKTCEFKIEDDAGVINSPGYPDGYPKNINCTWKLNMKPGKTIRLIVAGMNIGTSSRCSERDIVQISSIGNNDVICGRLLPKTIYIQSNEATITFISGAQPNGHGFSIFYAGVDSNLCGGVLTSASGNFESPQIPQSTNCKWIIDLKSAENIKISFSMLHISNDNGRCDNYLEILTGNMSNSQQYKKYCNAEGVEFLEPLLDSMISVQFVSNGKTKSMFKASYELVCGGRYHLTQDQAVEIKSPLFPHIYPGKKTCTWHLITPPQTYLSLHFTDFEIEHHSSCSYDYVSVYNGFDRNSVQLGQYCGNRAPLPVSSSMNNMMIIFSSDGGSEFRGFRARVTVAVGGCGGTFTDSKGDISSPSHPRLYSPNSMCVYTLTAKEIGMVVQLSFNLFALEEDSDCKNDYVVIHDGGSVDNPVLYANSVNGGRFCGKRKPPVTISSGRSLTVVFRTNLESSDEGFSAEWLTFAKPIGCDVYKTAPNGEIFSPYYPNFYSDSSNCKYTIEATDGHVIKLTFDVFNLEESTECGNDYVKVYDGENNRSPLIGQFCGSRSPGVILSSGNFLFMEFSSDLSSVFTGFHATFETGTNLCGGTLHGETGFITSPNYPMQYPADQECTWLISADVGNTIELTVEELNIESSPNCDEHDSLVIYDGRMFITQLCGEVRNKMIKSRENTMRLVFKSDDTLQQAGFKLRYRAGCGGVLDSRSGTIRSPSFPNPYPVNRMCNWTITGNMNDEIILNFFFFDLEYSAGCQSDYLLITEEKVNRRYCGVNHTQIRSVGHHLFLQFKSDGSNAGLGKGFQLNYTLVGCSQDFFNSNGSFATPNYPNSYPSHSYCKWRIRVQVGMKIQLRISNIHMENDCSYDNLTIYNGYTEDDPMLGQYCSKRGSVEIDSSSNDMTVLFMSDEMTNGKGFYAEYKSIKGGCGGMYKAPSGKIYSPNYPGPYPINTMCKWTVELPSTASVVNLTFQSFDIESNANCSYDYLDILDDVQGISLGKYCGQNVPLSIVSSANKMVLTLRSDSATTGKGFSASYYTGCGRTIAVDSNTGFISTQHYPSYYSAGDCVWVLTAVPGKQITLTFLDFHTEQCDKCDCDHVEVRNGNTNSASLIGRYCGTKVPHSITSSGNHLYVKFTADLLQQFTGFKASYTSLDAACGGDIFGMEGHIASPLYPQSAPATANCIWKITVSEGSVIAFNYDVFNLTSSENCENTYVELYDGETTDAPSILKTCGNTLPFTTFSTTNIMTVRFFSQGQLQSVGFKATFVTDCNTQILTASSGFISSPNYPRTYPRDSSCLWKIEAPTDGLIQIEFQDMDLEEVSDGHCYDSVEVRDGGSFGILLGSYCGFATPSSISSSFNLVAVLFSSDQSNQGTGFRLKYTHKENTCGGELIAKTEFQSFTSPGFPLEYPPNKNCEWVITAPIGLSLQLTFSDFMLEEIPTCEFDSVKLFESDPPGRSLITVPLCGNAAVNKTYFSAGSPLIVQFISDSYVQESGFKAFYKLTCGGTLTATKGVIRSRSSNESTYPNDQNCEWRIMLTRGSKIKLSFNKFKLENSLNCTKDYVSVSNGISSDSPVIGRYCGNNIPANITSVGNEVLIKFVTDAQNVDAGFEVVYEMFIAGCGGKESLSDAMLVYEITSPGYPVSYPQGIECEWTLEVPTGKVIDFSFEDLNMTSSFFCHKAYITLATGTSPNDETFGPYCGSNLPQQVHIKSSSNVMLVTFRVYESDGESRGFKASWKIGCGGYKFGVSGKFSSPSYPSVYPNNQDCLYIIEIPTKQQVHLSFNTFSLEQNLACSDDGDYVEVLNDGKNQTVIGRYCGSSLPNPIVSASHKMYLRFHSNSNTGSNGFEAVYTTVGKKCGGRLFSAGTFSTPFYPHEYPLNRACTWLLETFSGSAIKINFTDFHLENSINCTNDYVEVRNGHTMSSPVIGRYCGLRTPFVLLSSGNQLLVTFASDTNANREKGFEATFISSSSGCGGEFSGETGNITSPNYPEDYNNEAYCEWKISVAKDKTVHLTILDMQIEEHDACIFDSLQIWDGDTPGSILDTICGNGTSITFSSTSSSMKVVFQSDLLFTQKSFFATWKEGVAGCGGELNQLSGEIRSPKYPSNFGPSVDCVWVIDLADGMVINLKVEEMFMPKTSDCTKDKLLIQNGRHENSPTLATLCGNLTDLNVTRFESSSHHMRVHLKSTTAATPYRMFKLSYTSIEAGCGGKFSGVNGTITSPGYPNAYSANLDCEWIIETDPGTLVFLYIHDLDVGSSTSCIADYLEVRDHITSSTIDTSVTTEKVLARVCSDRHNSVYRSSQNVMKLRMKTDSYGTGKGFKVVFNTGCGGLLKGRSGYALTTNYPNTYPNNQDCRWVIDLKPHYHVRLTENDFNLPETNGFGVCYDYIEIREGINVTAPRIAQLCGTSQPPVYDSSYHQLLVRFVSDGIAQPLIGNNTWRAKAHFVAVCGEKITNSLSGTIKMPEYSNHEECEWIIEFPAGKQISLVTRSFNLEYGGRSCLYDFLEIRDGADRNAPLFGKFCGSAHPPGLRSTGNSLYIRFVSDRSATSDGFELQYSEAPLACGEILNGSSGDFRTPMYPNNFPDGESCGWQITVPAGQNIKLTFAAFNLPSSTSNGVQFCNNYINIYNAPYPNHLYQITDRLCGTGPQEPLISIGNTLYVLFHSGSFNEGSGGRGFLAEYEAITSECGGVLTATQIINTLKSPNYPQTFSVGKECDWLLEASEGSQVSIKIIDLSLPEKGSSGNCNSSSLLLADDVLNQDAHVLCGKERLSFTSSSRAMRIILFRESSAKGFSLQYTSVSGCNKSYTGSSGLITSPNHPLNYQKNSECYYHVNAPIGQLISLYPVSLDTELTVGGLCFFDYLRIYDGASESDTLMNNQSYCGKELPPTLHSSSNKMLLKFVTDASITHPGFAITYTTSSQACGGHVTGYKGSLTSPHFPKLYMNQYSCEWNITVSVGMKIRVNVTHFETEPPASGADCSTVDYLQMNEGNNILGTYCGLTHPAPRTTTGNTLQVKFNSNTVNNGYRGFQLFYTEVY